MDVVQASLGAGSIIVGWSTEFVLVSGQLVGLIMITEIDLDKDSIHFFVSFSGYILLVHYNLSCRGSLLVPLSGLVYSVYFSVRSNHHRIARHPGTVRMHYEFQDLLFRSSIRPLLDPSHGDRFRPCKKAMRRITTQRNTPTHPCQWLGESEPRLITSNH